MRPLALLMALLAAGPAAAQTDTLAAEWGPPGFTSSLGASVLLTNHGFGLGGALRAGVGPATSLVAEVSLGAGKDEREQEFFVGPFGETVTPFKRHYFLMLPLHVGVEQRLFRAAIEDDFRPYAQALIGPVVGYQWPYFEDHNANGIREAGESKRGALDLRGGALRMGVGGTLALGAYFGEGERNTFGVRIGYAVQYFPTPVQLLEPRPEIEGSDRRVFRSPVVSFHLLRLH